MKCYGLLLGATVVAGGGLRCWGLGAKSFWLDEALSWRLLDFSFADMLERTGDPHTVHPPVYFLLLRGWALVWGDSEIALRALAVVFGVLGVLGMFFFVLQLLSLPQTEPALARAGLHRPTALLAAALLALSVLQIHASQQVRAYSLGTALFLWSSWALLRALGDERHAGRAWLTYGLLAGVFCYTHHLALFSVAAQFVFVAAYLASGGPAGRDGQNVAGAAGPDLRRSWRWAGGVAAALALSYLPWLFKSLRQAATGSSAWQAPLRWPAVAVETYQALVATFADPYPVPPWLAWAVTGLLAAGLVLLAARAGWQGRYLLLTGLLPVLAILALSLLSKRSIYITRYLTFAQPAWLAAGAVLVGRIPFPSERKWIATLTLLWALFFCYLSWPVIGPAAQPGLRGAVVHILHHRSADEPLFARTPFVLFGALYYARGTVRPLLLAPLPGREAYRGAAHLKEEDLIAPDVVKATAVSGLWFISSLSYDAASETRFPLPDSWRLLERQEFRQDYRWERPVVVEHYQVLRTAPRASDAEEDALLLAPGPTRPAPLTDSLPGQGERQP